MTPNEIKASLKKVQVRQPTIAQKLKINRCTINRVITPTVRITPS